MKHRKNLQPKGFRRKYFSLAAILALNSALIAQSQNIAMSEKSSNSQDAQSLKLSITHSQEFVEYEDFKEEFNEQEIQQSNAQNIYDFLNTHSLLKITTNYGNPYTQMINLRGFNHKNLAIIIDGMRFENIDSSPISLSAIPLDAVEKIEIIRSSGTTQYGNGAVSGVLKIKTKQQAGSEIHLSYASYQTSNSQFFSRYVGDTLNIGAYGQYQHTRGSRHISVDSDEKDGSYNKNGGISASYAPEDSLLLKSNLNYAKYAIKYANPLTQEQFNANPTQSPIPPAWGGDTFTHQRRWDLYYNGGLVYFAQNGITTEINLGGNRNESEYINFFNQYEGKGFVGNFNSQYQGDFYRLEAGGEARGQNRKQEKINEAKVYQQMLYGNAQKYWDSFRLNGGISAQHINTIQNGTKHADKQENLIGAEVGANYKIHPQIEIFSSYARSFVSPNVDYMFDYATGGLNNLIDTATFDSYQIGTKGDFGIHTLSGAIFYIQGSKEAYYNALTWQNKSLEQTQRIGGEVKLITHFLENFSTSLAYSYVNPKITSGDFKGNKIPGISQNTLAIGANYLPVPNLNVGVTYKYGSKTYAYDDFLNQDKVMPNYQSLNLSVSYTYKDWEVYGFVHNLTNRKNVIVAYGGTSFGYYPYEFETTLGGGVKYRF